MHTVYKPILTITGVGWTAVIIFLTAIDLLHDWVEIESERLNNPIWWALQEWGLWYIYTPILFLWLNKLSQQNEVCWRNYLVCCSVLFVLSMSIQAGFDYLVYRDDIPYTLYYFAPLHPLVIYVCFMIWHKFIRIESNEENNSTVINQRLLVDLGGDKSFVQIKDIVHIVAAKNYVEIHTESRQYLKRATLSQFEAMLPTDMFVRTHRSYLVNMTYVERIITKASGNAIIKLSTGAQISLSKGYKKALKSRFDTLSQAA
ncbi:LytR/AlgR family response regulator transcription factor [Pseudoalteromonas maricaloris]|uniref:LytR/AlgR family response regulator transcription factor n=1 Tax=Pseudoalteromonas maricaloris TaxID=184924 RepID=UPI00057D1814|nr:LytTR family DNA-binding domain-containing protein [Pseudoalteromonas flavipulchra]KID37160.1 response regulator receiver protein [Pseudoalteromonas flavipulchra NCIMB 2033 = ATCC BAA-314]MBD0782971.1 LytTR family transcriptional regulator [Pseudoalteromonas flavipulchra]MBE0374777.1 hypothetical protein [Pseudoalteromonas flavipulchra NCIMB 2033 = ATCC BAA-314]